MNTRRSFLATLAALFAAPFLPKPEFIVQRVGGAHCENSPNGTIHTIRAQGEMEFGPVSLKVLQRDRFNNIKKRLISHDKLSEETADYFAHVFVKNDAKSFLGKPEEYLRFLRSVECS